MYPHQALPQQFPDGGTGDGYCILTGPAASPSVAGFLMVNKKAPVYEYYYAMLNITLPYTLPSGHVWTVEWSTEDWADPAAMLAWAKDEYPNDTVNSVRIDEKYYPWP